MRAEGTLLGTFLQIPSPSFVEMIGGAGLDFVILDLEHGEYDLSELPDLLRAAETAGLRRIVRVASNDAATIGKVLDFGAEAVLVPHIESAEGARAAVAAAKYPPVGIRGAYPFSRATGYRARHVAGWEALQNETTGVILLVEGASGIRNIDEIVAVRGVGAIFVGPVDLSHALGLAGDFRHPKVEELAREIGRKARDAGLRASIFCNDLDAAARYAQAGFDLIAFSVDAQLVLNAYRAAREGFDARLNAGPV